MERLRKTLILLMVVGIPAAAPPFFASSSDLCFTSGSVTYRLAPEAASPDYRVRIDNSAARPDLRIRLVDDAETADFALVDDVGGGGDACRSAGLIKTVKLVPAESASELTISVAREAGAADLKLFVHSSRVGHFDAAALYAAMRRADGLARIAANR
jgi:hypothetical protein